MDKTKIWGMLGYVFLTSILVYFTRPAYILSLFIVLIPPAIVNFSWLKKSKIKVLAFSLISTLLFAPPVELVTRLLNVWDVASIFPRPFGLIPLENMLFAFINILWGLSFYEYFVDRDNSRKFSPKLKYLVGLYIIFSSLVYGFYFINKNIIGMSYITVAVITLIIPATLIFVKNPKLIIKVFLPTLFFAIVFFIYEVVSIQIGSWWWPGEYLLPVNLFGKVFPIDDIIIWYFLSTPALIGGYEFFADDNK